MALETSELTRIFKYNSVDLPDPAPQLSAEDVRELYSATYPEILNASIEGPEAKDGQLVYTFRRAVGTKGTITLQIEISTVPVGGNEFGVGVRITGGPITPAEVPEGEGATLIGIGMAINEYMRSRGARGFNCLKGLIDV